MSKPKAPKPPDPIATAGAQTTQNVQTAIAQGALNNVNQVTPDGSLTYSTTGTQTIIGPDGKPQTVPTYTATQSLSAPQQAIKDQQDAASLNMATVGAEQSARMGTILNTPFDGSNDATEARIIELANKRLDPQLAQKRASMETQLSNQGIKLGSSAYDRAMGLVDQGENDARNQLILNGRGQALSEAYAARNQPINEISALMSGSQVSNPNFVSTNPAQMSNVDVAGLVNQNYAQKQANYNSKMAAWQGGMGGILGLGASLI